MSAFVSSRLARNHPQTAYSLQGKQCFFWSHPRCFGPLGKFQHNIKISIKTARVSRLYVSYDYGAMLNLDKNCIDLVSMLQYSNDQIMIFFGNDISQIHKLRPFSRIKLFEVSTYLNCLSLVSMRQYIKLVWKQRINIIFHKDQTNLQKQIKLK